MSINSTTSSTPTGATGAGGGDMIRITGLNTGLDVDALVKKMMAGEQTKLDKLKQTQQLTQWKQEEYQDIIKDVKDLQSTYFDVTNPDKCLLLQENFVPYDTTSDDESVVTVNPQVGCQAGKYTVNVTQLAQGARVSNDLGGTNNQNQYSLSTKLCQIAGDASLNTNLNLVLSASGSQSNATIKLDNTSGDETLGDLIDAINNQGGGSVKASFSELTGTFNLSNTVTGSGSTLTIEGGSSDFSKIFGSYTAGTAITTGACNADLSITPPGGTAVEVTKETSNNFTIDGMDYNLVGTGTSTVNVTLDTKKVKDLMSSFIDKYNSIVSEIETKLNEKTDKDYPPLTDSQKSSMKDSDITAWNEKAKSGVLRNDNNLQSLLTSLKNAFTSPLKDVNGNSMTSLTFGQYGSNAIGIDMGANVYNDVKDNVSDVTSDSDKISIANDTKFENALAQHPDEVMKLFTNASGVFDTSTTEGQENHFNESGIFQRINDIIVDNTGSVSSTFNSGTLTKYANFQDDFSAMGSQGDGTIPDQIYDEQLLIDKQTQSMKDKQEDYYQKFAKLESAMQELNSEQSSLSSMLQS